ncbi:Cell division control protein 25 [Hypsizygus marmoreus]|uniref:Cell division control protein 25 n=1 Tax=Hypsizygus marmoreus TaxID=39966 RepID=A0A369K7M6_HYPMA|nr:Cell division control protein 25 [Hypsizygus marmoreus]
MPTTALNARQHLHLRIDPVTFRARGSPQSNSASSSSASARLGTDAATASASTGTIVDSDTTPICSVLCMYDFHSKDPDHLSFKKNEILAIVRQEETGWWAALRYDSNADQIGWVPKDFVKPIPDEIADKLRNMLPELRGYEYEAEQLYLSAPTQPMPPIYSPTEPSPLPPQKRPSARDTAPSPQLYISKAQDLVQATQDTDPSYRLIFQYLQQSHDPGPPMSRSVPVLQPPYTSSFYTKPSQFLTPSEKEAPVQTRGRAGSVPPRSGSVKRHARLIDDPSLTHRLFPLHESTSSGEMSDPAVPSKSRTTSLEGFVKRTRSQRVKASLGLDDTPSKKPIQAQAWYLKPLYANQLELDNEGHVRSGTLDALVEKLTSETDAIDTIKMAEETLYRNIFLMTFRTFTTADVLFDMLVEIYRTDHPKELATTEFEDWKRNLVATQRRVLMIFTMWLEDHRLLEEEPHIAQRLTEFLRLIVTPPLASMARLLIKTIQRLTFATSTISPVTPGKARKSKAHKNDLLKLDPVDVAEQLALLEFKRYTKVTPQECLGNTHNGVHNDMNLSTFCSTHDKLAGWVKTSVLSHDPLGKRSDTIDFWIKVAEKCKIMNNFASMSAVINALSSTVVTRLHLTWAHVGRKSNLETLLRHNEPTGGFSGYRNLLSNVEGSCVPFVGMYLTDIAHIRDHFSDEGGRICFYQRQRWYEIVSAMLRYQSRPYSVAESESTMNFILRHLQEDPAKDAAWFWTRSQELQQLELAHADIRKGLEAAGF